MSCSEPGDTTTSAGDFTPQRSQADVEALADYIGEDITTEIYLRLLAAKTSTREELLAMGYAPETVDATITVLSGRGLLLPSGRGGWNAVPPNRSLPALAARFEERARTVRAAVPGLAAAYHATAAPANDTSVHLTGMEELPTVRDVAFGMAQCLAQARYTAKTMRTVSFETRNALFDLLPSTRSGFVNLTGHRIDVHRIIDERLVRDFTHTDFADHRQTPGERVAVAANVPFTTVVNDEGTAVVETVIDGHVQGLMVTHRGLVCGIEAIFDVMWGLAAPLQAPARHNVPALTDEEHAILTLMVAGLPDATIARRIGISPRTLERRVRALMDRLNASTRFQAGALAVKNGWL